MSKVMFHVYPIRLKSVCDPVVHPSDSVHSGNSSFLYRNRLETMEKVNKNFSGIYYHGKPDLKDNIIKYLLVIFSSFVSLFGCMQIFLKVLLVMCLV
jgi:hypothetical protein